jgi:nicotinate-nucleotide adenylyltransferase
VSERVGILGGTFDPPHVGHVVAAVNARHALPLDRVLVIPAGLPWQKVGQRTISPAEDRLAMVHATFDGIEGLEISTIELERHGDSYTADTLEALTAARPDAQLHLLVGSDVAPLLDTWNRPDVVRKLATIVVYERPGWSGCTPPAGWTCRELDIPQLDVSSTDIRDRVRAGRPIDGLVTREVAHLIAQRALYAPASVARS